MTVAAAPLVGHTNEQLDALFDDIAPSVQQSPADALAQLIEIRDEALRRDHLELAGHCAYLSARAQLNLGELALALNGIEAAERNFSDAGLAADAARTELGKMNVLDDLGRHLEAIDVGRSLLARLPELAASSPESTARLEAAAHENIGVSNGSLGNHVTALESYEVAERLYVHAGLELDAGRCTANRGVELVEMGRSSEAIDALRAAAEVFAADGDHLYAGMCAAYEASAELQRGDFFRAHQLGQVADEFLRDAELTTEYARSQRIRAETLVALNLVDEALALYEQLEIRFAETALDHDSALVTLGRANVLLRIGRIAEAAVAFDEAERRFSRIGDQAMLPACRLGASVAADAPTSVDVALATADQFAAAGRRGDEIVALLRAVDVLGRTQTHASSAPAVSELLDRCDGLLGTEPLPHLSWQVRRARGRAAIDAGDLAAARDHLVAATAEIERLRSSVADEVSLVPFMGSRRDVHEDLVHVHLAGGDTAGALHLVTAARARTLVESHESRPASSRAPVDGGDRSDEDRFDVHVTFELLRGEIVAFVDTGDGLRVVRDVSNTRHVERLLARLAAQWRRFDGNVLALSDTELVTASTLDLLQRLYDALLRPLGLNADVDGIVIVPVGLMANVPFAALHDGQRFVIEHTRVAVAASIGLTVDRGRRARESGEPPKRLVVGVPDEAAPSIADEIEAIAALGRTRTLVGPVATKAAFVDAVHGVDVIHVACHGLHRSDRPSLSSLQLADGQVTATEIGALELDGPLVVLSACSSGRQHASGNIDELMGLPRSFLAAGASAVLANLWQVDDIAASELMTRLHARLVDEPPASALRSAQLSLLAERPHPYFWAAAVAYVNLNHRKRQEPT